MQRLGFCIDGLEENKYDPNVAVQLMPEVGSYEVQILCKCTEVDVSSIYILLEDFLLLTFTFVHKYLFFLFRTLEKHANDFCF